VLSQSRAVNAAARFALRADSGAQNGPYRSLLELPNVAILDSHLSLPEFS